MQPASDSAKYHKTEHHVTSQATRDYHLFVRGSVAVKAGEVTSFYMTVTAVNTFF